MGSLGLSKTAGIEIANLNILVPNLIVSCTEPTQGSSIHVGNTTLWGDGIIEDRSAQITTCEGVTGVTGKGWYLYLFNGSPTSFTIQPYLIPPGTSIFFAIRYPAGTTFTITTDYQWGTNGDGVVTQVNTFAEVKSGDGRKYYFDGTHLYIKLVNHVQPTPVYFERDGVRIYSIQNSYSYKLTANCPGAAGGYCPVARLVPTTII